MCILLPCLNEISLTQWGKDKISWNRLLLEQAVVGVVRILHNPAGSGLTPPGVQVLQVGECSALS